MSTLTSEMAALSVREAERARPELRAIFEEHAPFVLRCVKRMGIRGADAEDVAQEVFVVVHRNLHRYDGRASMRSWLFGIVLRVSSDHRRRAHVRREVITDRPPDRSTPYCQVEANEYARLMERALALLGERQRAVFVLFELEGMPLKEIADAVGAPLYTVASRLRDARINVKKALEASLGGDRG
jgi:RNA polymerase sigma-70 factor, ECF subfamily